jgi:hypothetical protein
MSNFEEKKLIAALDEKAMWEEIRPVVKAIIRNGGGSAQALLKKSEIFAAAALLESLKSKRDDIRLKAAVELLNRSAGKPVERRIDIHADFSNMSEAEIDQQIKILANQVGEKEAIDTAFRAIPKLTGKRRQAQKFKQARREAKDFTIDESDERTEGAPRNPSETESSS